MYKPWLELEDIKKVVRSLLVSSRRILSPKELYNDYRRLEGRHFPYSKFGHCTFEDFLQTIPDVCALEFEDGRPVRVVPIVTEELQYIADLVSKQKEPVEPVVPKRRTCRPGVKKFVPANLQRSIYLYVNNHPKGVSLAKLETEFFSKFPLSFVGFEDCDELLESISHVVRYDRGNVYPLHSSCTNIYVPSNGEILNRDCMDFQILPTTIVNNIKKLLKENPDGILVSDFLTVYRKMFGSAFNPLKYGYLNILSVASAYPHILHVFRIDDEDFMIIETPHDWQQESDEEVIRKSDVKSELVWLIENFPDGIPADQVSEAYKIHFLKSLNPGNEGFKDVSSLLQSMAGVSQVTLKTVDGILWVLPVGVGSCLVSQPMNGDQELFSDESDELDQLLSHYYPADVLRPGHELPRQQLPSTKPGTLLPVTVCHAVSPTHFWAVLDYRHNCAMFDKLVNSMQSFYYTKNEEYKISDAVVQVGQYCVCPYHGEWHRAQITNITNSYEVQVYLIDLGVLCKKKNHCLRFLTQEFADILPAQALSCRLSGVAPVGISSWPLDTVQFFADMVIGQVFTAKIIFIEHQSGVLCVDLLENLACGDVSSIADRLLSEGFAEIPKLMQKTKPVRLSLQEQLGKFTCL